MRRSSSPIVMNTTDASSCPVLDLTKMAAEPYLSLAIAD
jgi:hypothetical protein